MTVLQDTSSILKNDASECRALVVRAYATPLSWCQGRASSFVGTIGAACVSSGARRAVSLSRQWHCDRQVSAESSAAHCLVSP